MTPITAAKLALALMAAILFAYGVRSEDSVVRWVGIAFVIVAFLLRFLKKRAPDESP